MADKHSKGNFSDTFKNVSVADHDIQKIKTEHST